MRVRRREFVLVCFDVYMCVMWGVEGGWAVCGVGVHVHLPDILW